MIRHVERRKRNLSEPTCCLQVSLFKEAAYDEGAAIKDQVEVWRYGEVGDRAKVGGNPEAHRATPVQTEARQEGSIVLFVEQQYYVKFTHVYVKMPVHQSFTS